MALIIICSDSAACCCQVASVVSNSVRPHGLQPTRLLHPWDSPGKNTGVGCPFLLQCMKVKSPSRVWLLATPWTAAYQAPPSMGFSGQQYWSGAPLPSPAVISEPFKRKSNTDCPSICHKVMGSDAMILVFRMLSLKPMFYSPLSIALSGSLVLPFCHKGGVICISEVISPGKLDSSLCLIQHSVSHEVPCIDVK